MKFKDDVKSIYTSDPFYDLFMGGYINPYEILESEDAERVNDAVDLILQFLDEAKDNYIIHEC